MPRHLGCVRRTGPDDCFPTQGSRTKHSVEVDGVRIHEKTVPSHAEWSVRALRVPPLPIRLNNVDGLFERLNRQHSMSLGDASDFSTKHIEHIRK